MERTRNRPVAGGADRAPRGPRVRPRARRSPGCSSWASWSTGSPRVWAAAGFLCYVLVYTVWLKRLTPQNIVIGGAAGAVPPLVGWAAVTGRVELAAVALFLIIFLWTPPHFWALAILLEDDYRPPALPDEL